MAHAPIDTSGGDGSSLPQGVPVNGEQEAAFDLAFGSSARENYHTVNEGAAPDGHLTAAGRGYFPVRRPAPFDPYGEEERLVRQKQDMEQQLANLPSGEAADIADAEALRAHRSRMEDYDVRLEEFEKADPGAFMGSEAAREGGYNPGGEGRMAAWDQANPRPERPNTIHDQRVALQGGISKLSNPKEQVAQNWSAHQNGVETYRRRQEYLRRYAPGSANLNPDMDGYESQQVGNAALYDTYRQGLPRPVPPAREEERVEAQQPERQIPARVADDLQEQPMGGQGPQGPALGNGPMLNQLVDGQWQMMPEEEKGAQAPVALPNVNTGDGAVNMASEAFRDRLHAAKPKPKRVSPEYDVSESEAAEYQGLMAGEGMKDVSTRHEGLDLPSARVHVPSDTSDLPEWVSEFSGPGGELDFFDNEDEKFELGKDVIRNVDQYTPNMAKESGPEEKIQRVFDGYKSNDKEKADVRKKFIERERYREKGIDISSKKMLEGDPADRVQNRQKLQIPTEDAIAHSGPMTIGGHEVVPEMENKFHDPRKPQGGWWRSAATGQKLGWAGLAGSKPLASPFGIDVAPFGELWQGHVVAAEKKREVMAKAKLDGIGPDALGEQLAEVSEQGRRQGFGGVADQGIVQAPAAGWGNIGKKPGMFAGKRAKEDYKQKTQKLDPDIDDAWAKMAGQEMPSFMKGVPYAEKRWRKKERDQRALEEQEALRKKWGMGADQLRRL